MRPNARRAAATVILATTALTGISVAPGSARVPPQTDGAAAGSVVVLGDSVAAGEGARAGYRYRDRMLLPGWTTTGRTASTTDPCGRSDGAYGVRVAQALGAMLTNLACTGASFEKGIVLDERFDEARPDLVLVTAGANSVAFERAYAYCVLSARGVSDTEAARIVRASTVGDALATALALAARRVLGTSPPAGTSACTTANPGAYLRETVFDRTASIGAQARTLAQAIRARGRAIGTAPQVVFTTYPDPLPEAAAGLAVCPDAAGLGAEELAFMHGMVATLNDQLRRALADLRGVRVADPDPAFVGHRWCDPSPWVHGPSIFVSDPTSRAPFHPTPAGQRAIADAVLATRSSVPGDWRGTV